MTLLAPVGAAPAAAATPSAPTVRFVLTQTLVRSASASAAAERLVPSPATAAPGDLLREEIAVTNVGSAALRGVIVAVPVPSGAVYAGSATPAAPGWTLHFSADRGRSYAARPVRTVSVTENGRTVRRQEAAPPETYTHVRWKVATLKAGETLRFSFRARVQGAGAQAAE
ncbi:hypothetical protein [Deinococcus petrolearius]|uniref:DUF11 domain-containing protein n=1 Tax=Deinococcus petrolearius TaxID=1751295 RepID=A0ABW1DDY4_9DEIO